MDVRQKYEMTTKILCELCSYPISDDRCGIELKCSTIPAPSLIMMKYGENSTRM